VDCLVSIACVSDGADFRVKEGVAWRVGIQDDVAWIGDSTPGDTTITAAIPAVFDAYATLVLPGRLGVARDGVGGGEQDRALLALLQARTPPQPWWLGYLDTGGSDIVFWDVPKVRLYAGWEYVLVHGGPEPAARWRPAAGWVNWKSTELPDVMFPEDRSWLASTLWDDNFICVGGSSVLIADLLADRTLGSRARQVAVDEDATPPGHGPR
jgi:hypothetical protein